MVLGPSSSAVAHAGELFSLSVAFGAAAHDGAAPPASTYGTGYGNVSEPPSGVSAQTPGPAVGTPPPPPPHPAPRQKARARPDELCCGGSARAGTDHTRVPAVPSEQSLLAPPLQRAAPPLLWRQRDGPLSTKLSNSRHCAAKVDAANDSGSLRSGTRAQQRGPVHALCVWGVCARLFFFQPLQNENFHF